MNSIDTQTQYLMSLKELHLRRLQILSQQAARQGANTPPEVTMEIQDIQAKIDELDNQLSGKPITSDTLLKKDSERNTKPYIRSRWFVFIIGLLVCLILFFIASLFSKIQGLEQINTYALSTQTALVADISIQNQEIVALQTRQAAAQITQTAVVAELILTQTAQVDIAANTEKIIAIDSQQDWQNTNVSLKKGDQVLVQVVGGQWTTWRYALPEADRSGFKQTSKAAEIYVNGFLENAGSGTYSLCKDTACALPQEKYGVLIGRINESTPFSIGEKNTVTASSDGVLFLRINDGTNLKDNFGILMVKIKHLN